MPKRRKSKKGDRKSKFPRELTIDNCHSPTEKRIITDAGFESVDRRVILQYFSLADVFDYWESYGNFEDLESESEIARYEELSNTNHDDFSKAEQQQFLDYLTGEFSWLTNRFDIVTARAIYGADYRWLKIIDILPRYAGIDRIDSYETEAIMLGLYLKQELNLVDLSVINDNKHAVANINGVFSFDARFIKDFIGFDAIQPEVFWSPRKYVKQADSLRLKDATRILAADDDLFTSNDIGNLAF